MFLTWNLIGAVPPSRFPPPSKKLSAGQAFVWIDRYLDTARTGPLWLRRPELAQLVEDSIKHSAEALERYQLHAYVVMANHVHMLVTPTAHPRALLRSLKSHTARHANKLLARSGPFWQKETYDHWVRNDREHSRIVASIENNPVQAGLVNRPQDYRWSSAYRP